MNFDFIHIIAVVFGISVFFKLIFELINELHKRIFPAYLNFFIAFTLWAYVVWKTEERDFVYLATASFLLILWFLFDYFILRKAKSKLHFVDYRLISTWNLLYFTFLLGLIVIYYLFLFVSGKEFLLNKVIPVLFAVNPAINKIIFSIIKSKQNLQDNAFILPKVRTFIFSSDKIISKNKYRLISFKNHSQLAKDAIIQTVYSLIGDWDKSLAEALRKETRSELSKISFHNIKTLSNGILAKDDTGAEYIFGNFSMVKDFVRNNDATHYLVKNGILIAKFIFRELFNPEGTRLAKSFDEYGNVVLLSNKPESNEYAKLPFDKIYFNLTKGKQKELIKNLTQKANTALITSDKDLSKIASFDFCVNKEENLFNIFNVFLLVKKVFSRLNNALLLFFAMETVLAITALFFFNQVLYVLAVNLLVSGIFVSLLRLVLKNLIEYSSIPQSQT